jgi:hypothetical protein
MPTLDEMIRTLPAAEQDRITTRVEELVREFRQQEAQKIIHCAQLLYEMFPPHENAPRWEQDSTENHQIWLQRSRALLEEMGVVSR